MKLIYVHLSKSQDPPDYLYTSIYQTCLISKIHIVILTNERHVQKINKRLCLIDKLHDNEISVVSIEHVEDKNFLTDLFRDEFWRYTTERFFTIEKWLKSFGITESFIHIENDVLLYSDPLALSFTKGMYIIKDTPTRGIGSVIFSTVSDWHAFIKYAEGCTPPKNDMEILGGYKDAFLLPCDPNNASRLVFDGAAFGQYIAGVDSRNIKSNTELTLYANPTVGFVNETSVVKACDYKIIRKLVNYKGKQIFKYYIKSKERVIDFFNLHIHSKNLAPCTSNFDIQYKDIITGDRILENCDIVFCTYPVYMYHKGINEFNSNVVVINDFKHINRKNLYRYITNIKKYIIKIHVYTHLLEDFTRYILPLIQLFNNKFVFYIHNSDHSFNGTYTSLLHSESVIRVYAQNISVYHEKLSLLPIGIANSMFKHGDTLSLYKTMSSTFINKKESNIFMSALQPTHRVRTLIDITSTNFKLSPKMNYKDYLVELSRHYFCFCPRGNGIDTHRFWEALYLGVIPVIVNTPESDMSIFVEYLKDLGLPFYQVTDLDFFKKNTNEFFSKDLYDSITGNKFIQCNQNLKLTNYLAT
ncbi:hypothetical protein SAGO17_0009 [Mimivirus AB-566-O17]|uniref:Exostosin GT47 domain-containing protein n=1 Tax=Mimivirus AB-566-O17 TaxID=1988039 RepID=A0A1X9VNN8_9VIRU|nr:hypothetical protein SAGO17_0009 [Mimivirus AB-566-O17]